MVVGMDAQPIDEKENEAVTGALVGGADLEKPDPE